MAANYWSQGDDRMCSSCWGPTVKHRYTCSFVFRPRCSLFWTLGVKYGISIFSAGRITSPGILLLGAPLAASGKQCSSMFTLVLQRNWGENEFEALGSFVDRDRAGSWLPLFLESRFSLPSSLSVFLDSPLPLSLTAPDTQSPLEYRSLGILDFQVAEGGG